MTLESCQRGAAGDDGGSVREQRDAFALDPRQGRAGSVPAGANAPTGIGPPAQCNLGTACRLRPLWLWAEAR